MSFFKFFLQPSFSLFFVTLLYIQAEAQTSITLQPDAADGKDAVLSSYNATTNLGSHVQVYPAAWTISGNPDNADGQKNQRSQSRWNTQR